LKEAEANKAKVETRLNRIIEAFKSIEIAREWIQTIIKSTSIS
jgi:hypothetical protein